jgi:predicted nucleotidyltransferase
MAAPDLARLTRALAAVPGVAAGALGGSRARGTATSGSDTDIGFYFHQGDEPKPDLNSKQAFAAARH